MSKLVFIFQLILLTSSFTFGQTILFDEELRDGNVPSGWSVSQVSMETGAGGYARFDDLTSEIISPIFDASAFSDLTVEFDVAKWGSGVDGPIDIKYSTDGGVSWDTLGNSPTPTSSTYLSATLTTSNLSANMQIKFIRPNSPSRKRLRDVVITASGASCADPTWYYRTTGSSNWADGTNWEASPDGIGSWTPANCPPDAAAQTITIQSGHTIQVTTNVEIDETIIEENAILEWINGDLEIQDGPGDDLTIYGKFLHAVSNTQPYLPGAVIRVKSDGVIEVDNNSPATSHYGQSNQIFYEDKAVFHWNVASLAIFQTANAIYFPNAGPNEVPIFRTSINSSVGAGSTTRINGFFEVESGTVNWINGGDKIFRNGLGGNGTIVQQSSSGRFLMDGDTAYIRGNGSLELDSDERLQTDGAVYVQLQSDYEINNGQFRITNPSTLDAQYFELSGSAEMRFNNRGTLRTQHINGVDGSIGAMGSIDFNTDREQTVIFERNGPQNSGINHLPNSLGALEILNGSELLLEKDMEISELSAGYFLIDGTGSFLTLNQTTELDIRGNRSFILQNGGTMDNSCLDYLRFETSDNSSTATFTGNSELIKCYNFTTDKNNSGGCIFSPNTEIYAFNNFGVDYDGGSAVFVDNGNTITVGDDLRLKGDALNFDFTGTFILTLVNAGTGNADIEPDNGVTNNTINAELHNLIVNSTNPNANVRVQGQNGTNDFVIKNDFTIQNMPSGRRFRPYSNIIHIGGNWLNQVGEAAFEHGEERVIFNGTAPQTINNQVDAEIFNEVEIDNSSGVTLLSEVEIESEGIFTSGTFNTTNTNVLTFLDGAEALNYSNNSYTNGPVKKNGNQAFEFPIGKNGMLRPSSISAPSSVSASFRSEFFEQDPDPLYDRNSIDPTLNNVSACEYWYINRLNSSDDVVVTLSWDDNTSCGVTDLNELQVARWNGSLWENEGNGGTVGNLMAGTINTQGSVSNFSPFTLASEVTFENPLPVELLYFDAKLNKNFEVDINWATATEINNDYFNIERSKDGYNWETIQRVNGAGNSNQKLVYSEKDRKPYEGISYYRLKQVDFDGSFEYSNIASVNFETDREIVKRINSAGQEVNEDYPGVVIIIYNNGDTEKIHQRNW